MTPNTRVRRSAAPLAIPLAALFMLSMAALVLPAAAQGQLPERKYGLSASAGVYAPGMITGGSTDWDTSTGYGLRGAADFYLGPRASMGLYLEQIGVNLSELDVNASVTAIGGTIVGHFGDTAAPHFRAGLGLAYQIDTIDVPEADASTGFGIAPFVDYVRPSGQYAYFAHLAFNSQPAGGNSDIDLTWGPIFTFQIGVEFGK